MSGLDTSQDLTVDASEHAEEHHEHSRKNDVEADGPAVDVRSDDVDEPSEDEAAS